MNYLKFFKSNKEIWAVLVILSCLLLLPIFSVVVMASAGSAAVTESLIKVDKLNKIFDVFDPKGNKIASVNLEVNWPTKGIVTDEFGTHDAFRKRLGLGPHSGIDIANKLGTPVTPFMDGVITKINPVNNNDCGKFIVIRHQYNIESYYCHLSEIASGITVGVNVDSTQVIGYMGSTGASTAPHLHLSTKVYGVLVNPRTFLDGEPPIN